MCAFVPSLLKRGRRLLPSRDVHKICREVVELDVAKKGTRDGGGCKSPRIRVAAEFEARQKKPNTDAGLGAGDQRELREGIRCARSRDCDAHQTALGFRRLDLAPHAGNWNLRAGRLPLVLGAEPRDGFFVGLDLGRRGLDTARIDGLRYNGEWASGHLSTEEQQRCTGRTALVSIPGYSAENQ